MSWTRKLVQRYMLTLIRDDEDVLQYVWSYESYGFYSVYPFGLQFGMLHKYLAEVEHLLGPITRHLFSEAYRLLMDYIAPSLCVTEPGIPNSEIDQKIKKYVERYVMSTLNLY
jgi:hypothetical protein